MGNSTDETFDLTLNALRVIKELSQKCQDFNPRIEAILSKYKLVNEGLFVVCEDLYNLVEEAGHFSERFLNIESGYYRISTLLFQLILLDYRSKHFKYDIPHLKYIRSYIEDDKILAPFFDNREDWGKMIIYLDYFGIKSWNDFAVETTGQWSEIHLLDESIAACNPKLDAVIFYIATVVQAKPREIMITRLGTNIKIAMGMNALFNAEVRNKLPDLIVDERIKLILPSLFTGLVQKAEDFDQLFAIVTSLDSHTDAFSVFNALGNACPNEDSALKKYKGHISSLLKMGLVRKNQYIDLLAFKNFCAYDDINLVAEISKTSKDIEELLAVTNYMVWNLEDYWHTEWFLSLLESLFVIQDEELLDMLEHLLYLLAEKDMGAVYKLFTLRFENLGDGGGLEEIWPQIVSADPILFQTQLLQWLNSDQRNVHRALLKLCTINISLTFFKLPRKKLLLLSSTDKLYIAVKIVGYIYSKDHLQSLIFSLMEGVLPDEYILMDNIFVLFDQYVIYNYRTSLETIKSLLGKKGLPMHLASFYKALNDRYQKYFNGLNSIRAFSELQPDNKLSQHIQFYTQHQFAEKYKKTSKTGLASLFKSTPVHAHRWAFRRDGNEMHDVRSLGHFESSIEYPSGEKLNPISQESLRRTYQKMTRHEVNIN